jgi:hypothetical protein
MGGHNIEKRNDLVFARATSCGAGDKQLKERPKSCPADSLFLANTLARCSPCWNYKSMAVQIKIRDVPERVRDELASRAALQGKSMQEFLRAELERLASRPSINAWLRQVRKRKCTTQIRVSPKQILENKKADRR